MAAKSTTASIIGGHRETEPPRQPSGDVQARTAALSRSISPNVALPQLVSTLSRGRAAVQLDFGRISNRQADRLSGGPV